MDVPACFPDVLPDVLDEGHHVVMASGLNCGDALEVEAGPLLDGGEVLDFDLAEPDAGFHGKHLDVEPPRELLVLGEDAGHLRPAVARNHAAILPGA